MSGRIGKVRMKETGFEFRVIEGPREPENDHAARLLRVSRAIAQHGDLAGFLVIAVHNDGGTSTSFRWDDEANPIPRSLVPAWLTEVVRREMVTAVEAEVVFHENFRWVE